MKKRDRNKKKESESQELTDLLKGVRAQCTEVKALLRAVVEMRGKAAVERMTVPKEPRVSSKLKTPRGSASGSLKPSGEPLLNLSPLELPDAPPAVPMEMRDVQVQNKSGFRGKEMWDVTFLSTGYVRVEKLVLNSVGQLEEPSEETMWVERFFGAKPTWPPHIRAFEFQNEALPQLLSRGIDRIF
jgi:hypothetical protein